MARFLLPLAAAGLMASAPAGRAFRPPASMMSATVPATVRRRGGSLGYVGRASDETGGGETMGWLHQQRERQRRLRRWSEEEEEEDERQQRRRRREEEYGGTDYEEKVDARFSRYTRRERLRRGRGSVSIEDVAAEIDRQRMDVLGLEERRGRAATGMEGGRRRGGPMGGGGGRLLSNTPIPIVNFRINADFPASELPQSRWHEAALPPVPFEEAEYSECVRVEGTQVLIPLENDLAWGLEVGHVVVFGGRSHVVQTIGDIIIPAGRAEHAYWLQEKIYDAIYGQVRRGTTLRRLGSPVQVMLPSASTSSEEEWALIEWMVTDEAVAIKEMNWEIVESQRMELAEDPIKEVAAMQHLQRFVEDETRREEDMRALRHNDNGRREDPWTRAWTEDGETQYAAWSPMERSHIVLPTDLLSDEENLYSVTPFCEGGRLLEVLEAKGRFSEPEARYWMQQILEGLSCLKRAGVCHRDMSPENLMVHEGNVYIIDLGMCLRIPSFDDRDIADDGRDSADPRRRSLILPQSACGKWYYLSPEVCESAEPFDGPAVDLWAAGVMLFTMLTGLPPWEEPRTTDENFGLMSTGHLAGMLTERRAGLSADALDLLQRMFWVDPADRLSLEQVMAHPWMTHGDVLPLPK